MLLDKALALKPNDPDIHEQMGDTLVLLDKLEPAMASYRKAMALDPSRARLGLTIGELQMRRRDIKGALATYRAALEADPHLIGANYLIGKALDESGKASQAAHYYELAIEEEPTNPLPYRALGYYFKGIGKSVRAVAAFQGYLAHKPDADDKDVITEEIGFLKH